MMKIQEHFEKEERAKRLVKARKEAGFLGPRDVANRVGVKENAYKGHESGRNGFGIADAKVYAKAFKVSLNWLYFGTGQPNDQDVIDKKDWHNRILEDAQEAVMAGAKPSDVVDALLDVIETIRTIAQKHPERTPLAKEVVERAAEQSRTQETSDKEDTEEQH